MATSDGGQYSQLASILPGIDSTDALYITATYYAHFEQNDNGTIVYNSNPPLKVGSTTEHEKVDGTVENTVAPYGSTTDLRLNTTADGGAYTTTYYVVTGWDKEPHDPNEANYPAPDYKLGDPITMPEGTTTLYAHWTPKTFTVTIKDGNDGNSGYVHGGTQEVGYTGHPVDNHYGTPDYWTVTYIDPITGEVVELPGKYTSLTDIPIYGKTTITPHWNNTGTSTTTTTTTTITTTTTNGGSSDSGTGLAAWLPKTGDALSFIPLGFLAMLAGGLVLIAIARRRKQDEEQVGANASSGKHARRMK
jgi:LPXTG-motif cell wall-anchored protein